jgi:hypothetical protein
VALKLLVARGANDIVHLENKKLSTIPRNDREMSTQVRPMRNGMNEKITLAAVSFLVFVHNLVSCSCQ